MSVIEELMQAALTAPDDLKARALRVLRGVQQAAPVERDTERFLTLKECAKRLGVSSCSLWRWQVPGHELGGRPKFRMSEIEAYLASDTFRRRAAELREQDRARRGGAK
jgi:predicted DNA-binding transcriptional regulator AlpA